MNDIVDSRSSKIFIVYKNKIHAVNKSQVIVKNHKKRNSTIQVTFPNNKVIKIAPEEYIDESVPLFAKDTFNIVACKLNILIHNESELNAFSQEQKKELRQKVPRFLQAIQQIKPFFASEQRKLKREFDNKHLLVNLFVAIKTPNRNTISSFAEISKKFEYENSYIKGIIISLVGLLTIAAGIVGLPFFGLVSLAACGAGSGILSYGLFKIHQSKHIAPLKDIKKNLEKITYQK